MDAKMAFKGQVCLDGFSCTDDLQTYIKDNGGKVKVELYVGREVVLIVRPYEPINGLGE